MLENGNVFVEEFEKLSDGTVTRLYTVVNKAGEKLVLCDYGATVISLLVSDRHGILKDVVLGYEHIADYEKDWNLFGATVGRVCGRISNGKFSIDETEYQLDKNMGRHHIHGGMKGFAKRMWQGTPIRNGVEFNLRSEDGDEHYPGNMDVKVIYTFDDNGKLTIEYDAVSDKDTICNMTNHTYFNLNGHDGDSICNHQIMINADKYLELDQSCIPTGNMNEVTGTVYDFREYTNIGDALDKKNRGKIFRNGYDNTFVKCRDGLWSACAKSDLTGIEMKCITTQNGIHFYTPYGVNVPAGKAKGEKGYKGICGFCFEMQNFPDAVNHAEFPSVILRADEKYHHITTIQFGIEI